MGIPAYFKYIKTKVKKSILLEPPSKTQNLFLDFNGIIHGCKEEVFSDNGSEKDIYPKIISYIEYIVQLIEPSQLLYIAIDGVAPRSKMEQQRKRRYKSAQDRNMKPAMTGCDKQKWDSNAISPGTRFMNNVDYNLYSSSYLKHLSKSIKVIVSNSSCPGEGEQKIFRYLRQLPDDDGINVIHGLDADLIMLSLLQNQKNIYLYREYLEKPFFININEFSISLKNIHNNINSHDYVFLSFIMGNDFLPHFYALYMRLGLLDKVLEIYNEIYNELNECLIIDNKINHSFLLKLIQKLSVREDQLVKNRANAMVYKKLIKHGHSPEEKFEHFPDYFRNKEIFINFGNEGWRQRYYDTIGETNNIENMCREYVNGLAWNIKYYTSSDPTNSSVNQSWYYPYLHAPLLKDLAEYLESSPIHYPMNNIDKKYSSLQQLAIILPPQSAHLLPKSWKPVILANDKIYVKRFKLDPIGAVFRWECSPELPFNDESILKELDKCVLTNAEKKRNKKHKEQEIKDV